MNSTASYICPCGDCAGEVVEVTFTGGFAGTSCQVVACSVWQDRGMVDYTVRRSAPLGWEPAGQVDTMVRHRDGLVWMAA